MDYHAVEGSPVIVDQLHERFPEYKDTIKCGDFTQEIPFDGAFDLIIDRAAITHNSTKNIESVIRLIHHYLNVQGYFVGIHWFSTQHPQFGQGKKIDIFTEKYNDGPFKDLGNVHYSDKRHLLDLFKAFDSKWMAHNLIDSSDDQFSCLLEYDVCKKVVK